MSKEYLYSKMTVKQFHLELIRLGAVSTGNNYLLDNLILSYIRIDKDKRVFSYCCKLKQYNRTCVDATLHKKCFNFSLLQ